MNKVLGDYKKLSYLIEILAIMHDIGKLADPFEKKQPFRLHTLIPLVEWSLQKESVFPKDFSPKYDESKELVTQYSKGNKGYIRITDLKENFIIKTNITSIKNFFNISWSKVLELLEKEFIERVQDIQKENGNSIIKQKKESSHEGNVKTNLEQIKNILQNNGQLNQPIGYTAIRHHFNYYEKFKPQSAIDYIIAQADNLDSAEDRLPGYMRKNTRQVTSPFGNHQPEELNCNQRREELYKEIANTLPDYLKDEAKDKLVDDFVKDLDFIINLRNKLHEIHKYDVHYDEKFMKAAPALGLVPDNDSTVWDHCFSTASIAKAIFNSFLLNPGRLDLLEKIRKTKVNSDDFVYLVLGDDEEIEKTIGRNFNSNEIIIEPQLYKGSYGDYKGKKFMVKYVDNNNRNIARHFLINRTGKDRKINYINIFRNFQGKGEHNIHLLDCLIGTPNVFAVQFPGRDFLTTVYRLPDYIGRKRVLDNLKKSIIKFIEEDLNLGNHVFSDINGMYFLIPELDYPEHASFKKYLEDRIIQQFNQVTNGILLPNISMKPVSCKGNGFYFGDVLVELREKYETSMKKKLAPYMMNKFVKPQWLMIGKRIVLKLKVFVRFVGKAVPTKKITVFMRIMFVIIVKSLEKGMRSQ